MNEPANIVLIFLKKLSMLTGMNYQSVKITSGLFIYIYILFQFFTGNYTYQLALSDTEAGVVNVIASTSGLFTLIFASFFPSSQSDKFTFSKFMAAILMTCGVVSEMKTINSMHY